MKKAIHDDEITKLYHSDDNISEDTGVEIEINDPKTVIRILAGNPGLHYIQYNRPLTPERRFFFIEINQKSTLFTKKDHFFKPKN